MKLRPIIIELKHHMPFTAFGALTGIVIMGAMILLQLPSTVLDIVFHVLHPLHILLSAFVTTSMYKIHSATKDKSIKLCRSRVLAAPLIGFIGSVGICSISDIAFPYIGSALLGAEIEWHLCFIEHSYIVIPSAIMGIIISYLKPATKCPHAAHVLISTWASLFYLLAFGITNWLPLLPFVFLILFIAVWVPCCVSDIVFPLLFTKVTERHHS